MTWLTLENRHTGEVLKLRRETDTAGVERLIIRGTLPAGADGPPLHMHTREAERGVVTSGTIGAEINGRQVTLGVGETIDLPAGSWHRWWNAGSEELRFEGEAVPVVDLDRYLQAVFEVVNAGPADRPPLFYIAHVFWRHRRTQRPKMIGPLLMHVVFPLVLGLGHLLGRYRGTSWPGCPVRCTGAPRVGHAGT